MTKEEFGLKLKDVSKTLHSLANDDGVWPHTSLYAYLFFACLAIDFACSHVVELEPDDSVIIKSSND